MAHLHRIGALLLALLGAAGVGAAQSFPPGTVDPIGIAANTMSYAPQYAFPCNGPAGSECLALPDPPTATIDSTTVYWLSVEDACPMASFAPAQTSLIGASAVGCQFWVDGIRYQSLYVPYRYVSLTSQACTLLEGGRTWTTSPGRKSPGNETCLDTGCKAIYEGTLILVQDKATGAWTTEGPAIYKTPAEACVYSAETGAAKDSCPNGTTGTVNGITTCVPYDPLLNVIESVKTTVTSGTSTTPSGTTPTTSTTTTTTTCDAGQCTTSETKATSTGGVNSTDAKSINTTQSEFCKDHPTDPQCASQSAFGGSCSTAFTCNGDAIMCAVARAAHGQLCELTKTSTESALYDTSKASPSTGIGTETVAIGQGSFDLSNALGVSATCIVDKDVVIMGQTVSIGFGQVCTALEMLGALLMSVSLLLAVRIVTRG